LNNRKIITLLGFWEGDKLGGPSLMTYHCFNALFNYQLFDEELIFNAYYNWWIEDGFDVGTTTQTVFKLVKEGKADYKNAAKLADSLLNGQTAGCNPMHRILPYVFFAKSVNELIDLIKKDAQLTHFNEIAVINAQVVALLVWQLQNGADWVKAKKNAFDYLAIDIKPFTNLSFNLIKPTGYAPDVLKSAFYFIENTTDFDEALTQSLEFAGVDNYCPPVVGMLADAIYGDHTYGKNHLKAYQIDFLEILKSL
jgi:ADP-ribosylglycohydrolase